jgi:predicted RNA-binding protein with PIN domain
LVVADPEVLARCVVRLESRETYNESKMRWLVDGYNVIRRAPELASRERESLEAGRRALCALLVEVARRSSDTFTVVFDGVETGGRTTGGAGVTVIFSSARESADRVLAKMARESGGAVVSNDREVRSLAGRAGAVVVTTDQFLERIERGRHPQRVHEPGVESDKDEHDEPARGSRKAGNPRRLSKKERAAKRALGRLDRGRF